MRLLFETGQNSSGQLPQHFGIITGGSQIKVWNTDNGQQIPINQSKFKLAVPKCLAITSTHRPAASNVATGNNKNNNTNTPLLAVGTLSGVIFLISLTTGELVQTLHHTIPQTASANASAGDRQLAVRDLLWSRDGTKLYSLSQQYVFEWNISINSNNSQKSTNSINTHKRFAPLAIFQDGGALASGFSSSQYHTYDPEETFSRIRLNYNEDKIIIGTNQSLYVFDINNATLVAKYVGFLGKVTSLSIDEPIHTYEQQQYHHLLQDSFKNVYPNNDNNRQFTEFYIAIATNSDRNITVYQYPPVPGTEVDNAVIDLSQNNAAAAAAKDKTNNNTMKNFLVTTHETCVCTAPDATSNVRLFTMYDNLPTHLSTGLLTVQTTDGNSLAKVKNEITTGKLTPTTINSRPSLLVGIATTQGQGQLFYLPSFTEEMTTNENTENNKKGKKSTVAAKKVMNTTTKTLRMTAPHLTIHDPTITMNNGKSLTRKQDDLYAIRGKNVTAHAKSRSEIQDILPMYRNGAICDFIVIDMAQVCVVRQSTIRPQIELVSLVSPQVKAKVLQLLNYNDLNALTNKTTASTAQADTIQVIKLTDRYNTVFKQWKLLLPVASLQAAANQSVLAVMKQDKLLQTAVRDVKTNNTHVLVNAADSTTNSKLKIAEDMTTDDIDIQKDNFVDRNKLNAIKRQKLLQHTAHLNLTLQELLNEQQMELEKVNDTTRYNISHPHTYDPLTAATTSDVDTNNTIAAQFNALMATLKGTLCAVLIQAIQSNDDRMVEHVIRTGVEGLSTTTGWTLLTQFLNNPQAMAKLDGNDDDDKNKDDDDDENNNKNGKVNSYGILTTRNSIDDGNLISTIGGNSIIDERQIQRGKTLITTVKLLPQHYIVPFINILTHKLHSNPLRSFELLPWIHVVLRLHSIYLLSLPDIGDKLYQISNILRQRCNTMNNIIQLKGRLEVILTQFNSNNQRSAANNRFALNETNNPFLPLNVYVEQEDDGEEQQNSDDVDMFTSVAKKRKSPGQVDNFKLGGLKGVEIDDEEEDADEDDEDMMMDDFDLDGEGEFDDDLFGAEGDDEEVDDFDNEIGGMGDDEDDFDEDDFDLDDENL